MVIGTKVAAEAIAAGPEAAAGSSGAEWDAPVKMEPWIQDAKHKKVLEKGVPEDAWPGIAGRQVQLRDDQTQIPGLLNAQGTKMLQLWIGSAAHTQKIAYSSIQKIEAEPIEGQEGYPIMRIQIGAAASNNYWIYYMPSQSVAGVKIRILGVQSLLD